MKVTKQTRRILESRRYIRDMGNRGYEQKETDWELLRGAKHDWRIVDAVISPCGKYVWTRIAHPDVFGPPKPKGIEREQRDREHQERYRNEIWNRPAEDYLNCVPGLRGGWR